MYSCIFHKWKPWPIKVHVWGGLGSQIHGCFLIKRLKETFPKQKFIFVHHEYKDYPFKLSQFSPEIKELFPNQKYKIKRNLSLPTKIKADEILYKPQGVSVLVSFLKYSKACMRYLMYQIGVIWEPKSNSINSIPLFCFHIVGHYTQLKFPKVFFQELTSNLILNTVSQDVFLHYRSGDLDVFNKEGINFNKIESVLREICKSKLVVLEVFSEDLEYIKQLFQRLELNLVTSFVDTSFGTSNILAHGVQSEYFIGTNSKISAWIAMLRCIQGKNKKTFLPEQLQTYFLDFRPIDCLLEPQYY